MCYRSIQGSKDLVFGKMWYSSENLTSLCDYNSKSFVLQLYLSFFVLTYLPSLISISYGALGFYSFRSGDWTLNQTRPDEMLLPRLGGTKAFFCEEKAPPSKLLSTPVKMILARTEFVHNVGGSGACILFWW